MLILVMGLNGDSLQYNIRQTLFKDGQSELVQSILYQKELTEIIICPVKHYRLLTSKSNSENFLFNRPQICLICEHFFTFYDNERGC